MNKVIIRGGLGNQMFQYALCSALNQKGVKSRISFSYFFYSSCHNGFDLDIAFKLDITFPFNFLKFLLLNGEVLYMNRVGVFLLSRFFHMYHRVFHNIYKEKKEFEYDEDVFNQQSCSFLGTWQVESFFKDLKDLIHHQFRFNKPNDIKNIELIKQIRNSNSVSIHIRRGDYLSKDNRKTHNFIQV